MAEIMQNFQFAAPFWLWGLVALPVLWGLYALFYKQDGRHAGIEKFADPHLLPHLLEAGGAGNKRGRIRLSLLAWSLLWAFALLAMAGPRWDYTEVEAFAPARNLVILLDLSQSMDAADIKPSRLVRARQEIDDLLRLGENVNIGLIAFDSVPHVITPLTDDRGTLSRLLPSLETGLVYVQGGNLAPALRRAGEMLAPEPGKEKHILVISDGSFSDGDAEILKAGRELEDLGIRIHVMGTGTKEGAPIPDGNNGFIKDGGRPVISALQAGRLKRIAQDGGGLYLEANYLESDAKTLLSRIDPEAESEAVKTTRFWEERYYLFLIPAALLLLPWFRRNAAFPVLLFMLLQPFPARAFEWSNLFMNKAQQGQAALEDKQYDAAIGKFDDSYRRGVAEYKAGKYEEAEKSFQAADRPEVAEQAQYNLGNAQLMGGKAQEAIDTYEKVLKENPDHKDAAHNLEIAKKLLEQQQQQGGQQDQKQDGQQGDQSQQQGSEGQQGEQQGKDQQQQSEAGNEQQKDGEENPQSSEGQSGSEQKEEEQQQQAQSGGEKEEQQEKQEQQGQQAQQEQEQQEQGQSGKTQKAQRSQQEIDADQWLNRIESDPETFLRNKFYIESERQGAKKGKQTW